MKDRVKTTPICNTPKPLKIKEGRVKITLEDKAGNREVIADHNMMTNAIEELMSQCGWLNRDNFPQDNLVPELLGGILLLNDTLEEDADITHIPSGVQMIANGAIGTTNTGTPYELGSCSDIATETGWQSDGSYLMTFRWDENHGNCPSGQSIKAVALTSKAMGYAGIGNQSGIGASGSNLFTSYTGSNTVYVLGSESGPAYKTAKVSILDSTAYRIDLSDSANGNIVINQYRIPTGKVNLKGTTTAPYLLGTRTVTTSDSDLIAALTYLKQGRNYGAKYYDTNKHFWIWTEAGSSGAVWGSTYTQYLWNINVETGAIQKYTVLNTSGDTLRGIVCPAFIETASGTTVLFVDGYSSSSASAKVPGKVYKFSIASGTVGAITAITNDTGRWGAEVGNLAYQYGASEDGKVIVGSYNDWSGGVANWNIVDIVDNTCLPINLAANDVRNVVIYDTDVPAIKYSAQHSAGATFWYDAINLYRQIDYIATIFNCQTAYTKDATKTMTVTYRLTFEDDENE